MPLPPTSSTTRRGVICVRRPRPRPRPEWGCATAAAAPPLLPSRRQRKVTSPTEAAGARRLLPLLHSSVEIPRAARARRQRQPRYHLLLRFWHPSLSHDRRRRRHCRYPLVPHYSLLPRPLVFSSPPSRFERLIFRHSDAKVERRTSRLPGGGLPFCPWLMIVSRRQGPVPGL